MRKVNASHEIDGDLSLIYVDLQDEKAENVISEERTTMVVMDYDADTGALVGVELILTTERSK